MVGQAAGPHLRQTGVDDGLVLGTVARPARLVRKAAHHYQLLHRAVKAQARILAQHRRLLRKLPRAHLPDVAALQLYLATGLGLQHTVEHAHQGRFAATIGPHQTDTFAARHLQAGLAHDRCGLAAMAGAP